MTPQLIAPISVIGGTSAVRTGHGSGTPSPAPESASAVETRALLPATAPALGSRSERGRPRPSAPFLAQLLAAKANLPQARERRRAEPHEALAAYAATAGALRAG